MASFTLWLAILISAVASTSSCIGKALQKQGAAALPRLSLEPKALRAYARSPLWLAGMAADLGGGVLQMAAFALAPVSVVQPVSGVGLVGLAVYSHFYSRERLRAWDWAAVALAAAGTLGLGASAAGGGGGGGGDGGGGDGGAPAAAAPPPGAARMLVVLAAMAGGVAYVSAGGCFGLSAAACRAGFVLASARARVYAPAGVAAAVALSTAGFVLQTGGLKDGASVVVVTCAAVSSMVAGVVAGLAALGEGVPRGGAGARLAAWAAILGGVTGLAAGPEGARAAAAACAARLPPGVWRALPTSSAVRLRAWLAAGAGLPLHAHDGGADGPPGGGDATPPGKGAAAGLGGILVGRAHSVHVLPPAVPQSPARGFR